MLKSKRSRMAATAMLAIGVALGATWQVTSAAQNVVVLVDDSGSMDGAMSSDRNVRRIDAAKDALRAVLQQVPDDAKVGVLALNTPGADGRWLIPLGPLDRSALQSAIELLRAQGGTELGANMKVAADGLLELRDKQLYGDYRLLIVTDGEAQDAQLVDRFLPEIRRRGLTVDVIGVSMEEDHSLATRVDAYRRANDASSLQLAIEASMAESLLDPNDPDEAADFELLAAIPDEIAVAAIQALTQVDNRPIGSAPVEDMAPVEQPVDRQLASRPGGPRVPVTPPPAQVDPRGGGSRVRTFVILGIILCAYAALKSVLRGGTRRSA